MQCPLPCVPSTALFYGLPSLQRVPSSRFPAFTDTTETLRHPALHTGRLWFRFRLPRFPPLFRVSLARSRQTGGSLFGPGAFSCRLPPFRLSYADNTGLLRFLGHPSHASAMFHDPGRIQASSPLSVCLNTAPAPNTTKAPAVTSFRGQTHTALTFAVYASRTESPLPMQDWLPAGGLAFAGRESNPLDRYERFPVTYIPFPFPRFILTLAGLTFGGRPSGPCIHGDFCRVISLSTCRRQVDCSG